MARNKVYVATDGSGEIMSVVGATDRKAAEAFWQGQGTVPITVAEIDLDEALLGHPSGVTSIAKVNREPGILGKKGKITSVRR